MKIVEGQRKILFETWKSVVGLMFIDWAVILHLFYIFRYNNCSGEAVLEKKSVVKESKHRLNSGSH